jgi:hypothetical protein
VCIFARNFLCSSCCRSNGFLDIMAEADATAAPVDSGPQVTIVTNADGSDVRHAMPLAHARMSGTIANMLDGESLTCAVSRLTHAPASARQRAAPQMYSVSCAANACCAFV